MDSGRSSGMTPSCKWPRELKMKKKQHSFVCYDTFFSFLYFVSFPLREMNSRHYFCFASNLKSLFYAIAHTFFT